MSRPLLIAAFLTLSLQVSQAQLLSHGVPASVTSPTADGRLHGVPASVVSPTQRPFGVNPPLHRGISVRGPLRRFGNAHGQRRAFIPVPLFFPIYGDGFDPFPSVADPSVPLDPQPAQTADSTDRSEEELRAAYQQGVHDAIARQDDRRYGEHFLDSRERSNQRPAPAVEPVADTNKRTVAAPVSVQEDKSPTTVFIFKDGHQLETKNYAIMSGTLFDFSGKTLKKIQVNDLDMDATVKANDDRGVTVKLN